MVSVYDLKPRFQALLRPLCIAAARAGITANMVTLAAMALSIVIGALLLAINSPVVLLLLPATLFIRMALNAIDGMLAREHGQKSALGALLNEIGDVVSDAALYLPLAVALHAFSVPAWLVVLFVLCAMLTEFAGVAAALIGATRRYDGPMGKSDRAAAIGLLATILALGAPGGWWIDLVFFILTLLAALTVINRCRGALAERTGNP